MLVNWVCETDDKNAGEKRVDIHDQQRESSQKSLTCAAAIRPKETRADIYPMKLCRRAVQQILKMERWYF